MQAALDRTTFRHEDAVKFLLRQWGGWIVRSWNPNNGYPPNILARFIPQDRRELTLELLPNELERISRAWFELLDREPKYAAVIWAQYVWGGDTNQKIKRLKLARFTIARRTYFQYQKIALVFLISRLGTLIADLRTNRA